MKSKTPKTRFRTQVFGVMLVFILLLVVSAISLIANSRKEATIDVVRLKNSINTGYILSEKDIEKHAMKVSEYESAGVQTLADGSKRALVVTWDYKDLLIGKAYASSYLYSGSNLLWTMITKEQTKRHSYLYSMDGELLNIQMSTDDFGEMVVPGDKLNIRVSYKTTDYDLPTDEEYLLSDGKTDSKGVEREVTEMLFNEVIVLDMLNADGASIFDIYYNFISLSKSKQATLLSSDSFKESVKPNSILLQVTAEQAERFISINQKSPTFLMTLLPRTSSNAILDSISNIEKLIKQSQSK